MSKGRRAYDVGREGRYCVYDVGQGRDVFVTLLVGSVLSLGEILLT